MSKQGPSSSDAYAASFPLAIKPAAPKAAPRKSTLEGSHLSRPLAEPGAWLFEVTRDDGIAGVCVTSKYWFDARRVASMAIGACPGELRLVGSPFTGVL